MDTESRSVTSLGPQRRIEMMPSPSRFLLSALVASVAFAAEDPQPTPVAGEKPVDDPAVGGWRHSKRGTVVNSAQNSN